MLGKESLNPIVDAINNDEYQAVFPKEWWTNTGFYVNIFPGRVPEDPEECVNNYIHSFCLVLESNTHIIIITILCDIVQSLAGWTVCICSCA